MLRALIACFLVYAQIDQRIDSIETAKAVAEAEAKNRDRRMDNFGTKLDTIYQYVISTNSNVASKE